MIENKTYISHEPTTYWSIIPGKFLNKWTGAPIYATQLPSFSGTPDEWNETLVEELIGLSRLTAFEGATVVRCSSVIFEVLSKSAAFRNTSNGPVLNHRFKLVTDETEHDSLVLERPGGSSINDHGCVRVLDLPDV